MRRIEYASNCEIGVEGGVIGGGVEAGKNLGGDTIVCDK